MGPDSFECSECGAEALMEDACWSELRQANLCLECYLEVEEN